VPSFFQLLIHNDYSNAVRQIVIRYVLAIQLSNTAVLAKATKRATDAMFGYPNNEDRRLEDVYLPIKEYRK
jgi:hypothetical protein